MKRLAFILALALPVFSQTVSSNELIVPRAAAPRIYVPVAGNAAGANGTFFRSDVTIVNLRTASQRVLMYWLPQVGTPPPAVSIDLPAQSGISSEDFVGEILGRTGIGGIEIVGVTAEGVFDPNAALHVASRIWTPRPDGAAGTFSQTFPAVVAGAQETAIVKAVFGMRRTSQYRMNVGVMNPSNVTQRFRVTAAISTGGGVDQQAFEFDVPARSIQQVAVPGTSSGLVQILIEDIGGGAGDWQGWASSVDNASGDAWSQIAVGGD